MRGEHVIASGCRQVQQNPVIGTPFVSVPITGCVYARYGLSTLNTSVYPRIRKIKGSGIYIAHVASRLVDFYLSLDLKHPKDLEFNITP